VRKHWQAGAHDASAKPNSYGSARAHIYSSVGIEHGADIYPDANIYSGIDIYPGTGSYSDANIYSSTDSYSGVDTYSSTNHIYLGHVPSGYTEDIIGGDEEVAWLRESYSK